MAAEFETAWEKLSDKKREDWREEEERQKKTECQGVGKMGGQTQGWRGKAMRSWKWSGGMSKRNRKKVGCREGMTPGDEYRMMLGMAERHAHGMGEHRKMVEVETRERRRESREKTLEGVQEMMEKAQGMMDDQRCWIIERRHV